MRLAFIGVFLVACGQTAGVTGSEYSKVAGAAADPNPTASAPSASTTAPTTPLKLTTPPPATPPVDTPPGTYRARYPENAVHSPISPAVAARWKDIASKKSRNEASFMKVGDSITVATTSLGCFAQSGVDLGAASALQGSLDFFKAAAPNPFSRTSLAAKVGWSANGPLAGSPSLLDQELAAMNARVAVVQFGGNDVEGNAPYTFGERMWTIVNNLTSQGVVPILMSIPPRGDSADSNSRVPIYNRIIKSIAEAQQLPFVQLHDQLDPLASHGLIADGLHLNSSGGGCVLTESGLASGSNVRNLLTLQALDRVRTTLASSDSGKDDPGLAPAGTGTKADPFVIDSSIYVHSANTTTGARGISSYACAPSTDESGPELYYKLEVSTEIMINATVITPSGAVDVDVHLMDTAAEGDRCISRANQAIQNEILEPGTYFFSVDSYTSGTSEKSGDYIFIFESF